MSWRLAFLAPLFLVGCVSRDPIASWQTRVTSYVQQHGHGDPGVLRELTDVQSRTSLRPARLTVGEIGVPSRGPTPGAPNRDVQAVLLGAGTVQSQRWFFFLLGVIARGPGTAANLEDIRLVAGSSVRGSMNWVLSSPNEDALARYQKGHQVAPEDSTFATMETFPHPLDDLTLDVRGHRATVADRHTGAVWELQLPAPRSGLRTGITQPEATQSDLLEVDLPP